MHAYVVYIFFFPNLALLPFRGDWISENFCFYLRNMKNVFFFTGKREFKFFDDRSVDVFSSTDELQNAKLSNDEMPNFEIKKNVDW
jgi:hypothetical protein